MRCPILSAGLGRGVGKKRHLGAHFRQHPIISVFKFDLGQNGRLRPVGGRNDRVDHPFVADLRKCIEGNLRSLAELDFFEVRFRDIDLDLQRGHVGDGDHGRLRRDRRPERRDHLPHLGIPGENGSIERRADEGAVDLHLRPTEARLGRPNPRFRRRDGRPGPAVAGLGGVKLGLRDQFLIQQCFSSPVDQGRLAEFRLRLSVGELGHVQVGLKSAERRIHIGALKSGDDFSFSDRVSLFDPQIDQPSGRLGGDRRPPLRHHIPAGIEDDRLL